MGSTCVKLYMIIVFMFTKNPSSLQNIDLDTNFKCVKRMDSQISNLITHDNMIHLQNWVLWNLQVQNMSFLKIVSITPHSISSNYKLSMATFNNILQVQSNCLEAPSMCTQCVKQFFMPLDLGHTCHGSISQMTSWLKCPQNILLADHHPIWHLLACPLNML